MMPHEQRQERVEQYEASTKADIADNRPQAPKEIHSWRDGEEQHRSNRSDECEDQKQLLAIVAMVCGSGHGDDNERLEEHTDGKGVHRETSSVDLMAEKLEDALAAGGRGCQISSEALDSVGFAWFAVVFGQNCCCGVSSQVFECHRDEGSEPTYYEHFGGERVGVEAE